MTDKKDRMQSGKRTALVRTARELFFRYGIRRVSVREICREARVSKMTFYRYFQNKNALVLHILNDIVTVAKGRIDDIMEKEIPFIEKLKHIIAMKIEMVEEYNRDFFKELLDDESEAGKYLAQKRQEANEWMRKIYTDAQMRGEIRSDIRIEFILYMMDYLRVIMKDERIHDLYPDPCDQVKAVSNLYMYGFSNR